MDRSDFGESSEETGEFVITHCSVSDNQEGMQTSAFPSQFSIPIRVSGSPPCVIGFGIRRDFSSPPEWMREQLKRAGEVFAQAVYRKRAEYKLKERSLLSV